MGAGTLEAPAGICQLDQASITGLVQTMKNAREQTMWKLVTTLVAFVSLGIATGTQAEEWPTRPLTMINPFAAGGPNDVLARLFAQRMGELLGQPIVIENIGDAGGNTPSVREKLESAGLKFVSDDRTTPEYLAKFVQSEIAKWAV